MERLEPLTTAARCSKVNDRGRCKRVAGPFQISFDPSFGDEGNYDELQSDQRTGR